MFTPDGDTREFWQGCEQKELRFQRCSRCNHVRWPPAFICPICHGAEAQLVTARGRGTIFSYTVFRTALDPAWPGTYPYVPILVDLEEGPRIPSNLVDCDPSEVYCGMAVELVWAEWKGAFLPKFRPCRSAPL